MMQWQDTHQGQLIYSLLMKHKRVSILLEFESPVLQQKLDRNCSNNVAGSHVIKAVLKDSANFLEEKGIPEE
jgi:hypothetical protein